MSFIVDFLLILSCFPFQTKWKHSFWRSFTKWSRGLGNNIQRLISLDRMRDRGALGSKWWLLSLERLDTLPLYPFWIDVWSMLTGTCTTACLRCPRLGAIAVRTEVSMDLCCITTRPHCHSNNSNFWPPVEFSSPIIHNILQTSPPATGFYFHTLKAALRNMSWEHRNGCMRAHEGHWHYRWSPWAEVWKKWFEQMVKCVAAQGISMKNWHDLMVGKFFLWGDSQFSEPHLYLLWVNHWPLTTDLDTDRMHRHRHRLHCHQKTQEQQASDCWLEL